MQPEDLLLAAELSPQQVDQFLSQYGFKDPQAADRNLQLMAEDLSIREMLARIIGPLLKGAQASPDPDAAFNNLERLLSVVTHRANFLGFLGDTPEALEALTLLCGTSPFSSEILIRNPEYFYWLLDQLGSTWIKSRDSYLQEARQATSRFSDSAQALHALARFKRREMLRIATRDILKISDVIGTVTELSNLADAILQLVYEICYARLVHRFGSPQFQGEQGKRHAARFTILGMGKLGGRELNYSSDIDLIYVFDGEQGATVSSETVERGEQGSTDPIAKNGFPPGCIPNPEFFKKLAQSITHELSNVTEEGYFYRVDLRLRPEGSAGSVASSLSACKNYYATWGETFERLALIKARPVAGSAELGQQFCEVLNPFVYRKFLDFAALEEIQEIKARINSKLGSKQKQALHVKLGTGGIREIEFFAQALQLIYGGYHPDLRERSTLKALEKLLEHHFLTANEHDELRQAYLFLRDLEHKLQMVFHFQTHELPTAPDELYKCARRLGIEGNSMSETLDQFFRTYQKHTTHVSRIFQNLIALKRDGVSASHLREASLALNKNLTENEAFAILSNHGFEDLKTAFHQIVLLRDALSFSHSPSKMRNLLANLLPPLLLALQSSPDPDAGLGYFEKFASALGERDSLYTLLNESPDVLKRLIRVLSSSPFLADFLCRRPEFFDSLIRQDSLQKRKKLSDLRNQLQLSLRDATTFEASQSALRAFQQIELFRIGTKDVLGQLARSQVGRQLAELAEACLNAAFGIACQKLETHFGPHFSEWARDHFAILALGKLGGSDLSYNSDLDLVCFYSIDDVLESTETQHRFVHLIECLDEILSVSRGEGSIYKIDLRLRPEGKKGELVVALHRYQEYLESRVEDWERLALVRHRFVLGGRTIRARLKKLIEGVVYRAELSSSSVRDILRLRQRMEMELGKEAGDQCFHVKAGKGGLLDVEFATQLLQMKHGWQYPELRISNTVLALRKLRQLELLPEEQFQDFYRGYEFLRLLDNRPTLASPYNSTSFPRTPKILRKMARLLSPPGTGDFSSGERLESAYVAITQNNRKVFQEVLTNLSETKESVPRL
ncbi:MAG: bifunctional [glutamate--ammonia ligase]-adenylyl-L-tyrosine phosphorylase/[glutamate--ammonia-ligase] adenylyltransferase [Acidobacteria bacterium]|nr:MAG: bifunctional [glutamate--ammonia ligase]-adenylyl-L-tyrosine phosphorylase/[glutamate--ammonia-ligase] adenylyltransferase [Acidobacteriota bacterium]